MITSSSLTQLATDLRSLSTSLEGLQTTGSSAATALADNTEALRPLWQGPRADAVLGAGDAYRSAVFGSGTGGGWAGTVSDVVDVIDRWATSADEYADQLAGQEATLYSFALTPEDADAHQRAANADRRAAS